jgi:hypothetical protein
MSEEAARDCPVNTKGVWNYGLPTGEKYFQIKNSRVVPI